MAKLIVALALGGARAFAPVSQAPRATLLRSSNDEGLDVRTDAGAAWTPQSGGMESTDTPDFFYEDDDNRGDITRDIGFTDGILGSNTRKAIRAYQKAEGLVADGFPSEQVLAALGVYSGS